MSDEQDAFDMKPRLRTTIRLVLHRTQSKIRPANATCNNGDCGYRGRRSRRGKWCPACWDDGGGELIRDTKEGTR